MECEVLVNHERRAWTRSFYEGNKRLTDVAVAGVLLVILAPLLALVCVAVRVTSVGAIFFTQDRVGLRGRNFRIIKFRTMVDNADQMGPSVTSSDDPRITRLGRLLRATKIDELPQLINVVRGDMSLVGPRPQVPRYVSQFPEYSRAVILSVRPGITGPTALVFRHEEEMLENRADREEFYLSVLLPMKCDMDVRYVHSRSAVIDSKVLIETGAMVSRGMLRRMVGRSCPISMPVALAELVEDRAVGLG